MNLSLLVITLGGKRMYGVDTNGGELDKNHLIQIRRNRGSKEEWDSERLEERKR